MKMSDTRKKPNVLFLLTDDQRYGTIHALGNDEISTPNLDFLVGRGMAFTNAHIPGGHRLGCLHAEPCHAQFGQNAFPP